MEYHTSNTKLSRSIRACLDNAERLLEEVYDLEFRKPAATRYFIAIIAQEECAKAFVLYLVKEEIVPLTPALRRAIYDHACKHLVGMIMDYMIMHWETTEELTALIEREYEIGLDRLPNDVGSAIEIFCYEKIGRWAAKNWSWAEDPSYDPSVLKLAGGKKDRRKQDALYVRIGSDGQVASTPSTIKDDEVEAELAHAVRYLNFIRSLADEEQSGFDSRRFEKIMDVFGLLFGTKELQAEQLGS